MAWASVFNLVAIIPGMKFLNRLGGGIIGFAEAVLVWGLILLFVRQVLSPRRADLFQGLTRVFRRKNRKFPDNLYLKDILVAMEMIEKMARWFSDPGRQTSLLPEGAQ